MNFINWNARGIRGKKSELSRLFDNYDICCITETKLKNSDNINFAGYNCIREDRTVGGGYAAGGVLICIRKGIKYGVIHNLFLPSKIEGTGIKVSFNNRDINFVVIYRSPCDVNNI